MSCRIDQLSISWYRIKSCRIKSWKWETKLSGKCCAQFLLISWSSSWRFTWSIPRRGLPSPARESERSRLPADVQGPGQRVITEYVEARQQQTPVFKCSYRCSCLIIHMTVLCNCKKSYFMFLFLSNSHFRASPSSRKRSRKLTARFFIM